MKKQFKHVMFIMIIALCIIFIPGKANVQAASDWITLPEMKEVPLTKTFTIKFNKKITNENIDGVFIYQNGKSIPLEFDTKDKSAYVKAVANLVAGKDYELRVMIGNKRYKMNFTTVKESSKPVETDSKPETNNDSKATIEYKGITDVRSQFADNQLIQNMHHYVINMGEGHLINAYVTDDYEKQYGKGYAYEETIDIIQSIEKKRNVKPYTTKLGTLDMFFYTEESRGALPSNYQAALGRWSDNTGAGVPTEMVIYGDSMPYDFRTSYVHEFIHYFDFQSFISQYSQTYQNYWGENFSFWLLEGGAEYGGYFFYDYPGNTKNNMSSFLVQPTKESIKEYAKQQGSYKKNLLYDVELNSFDDIYAASSNNYGITLALFWYLVETYGYEETYDYVRYVGESFNGQSTISQKDKDQTAIKFLGETEEQVLKDWLSYFDYFDGELAEFKEITTGTVNHVFFENDPLLADSAKEWFKNSKNNGVNFLMNIKEWHEELNYEQANNFMTNMTRTFKLVATGYEEVNVQFKGWNFSDGKLTNGEWLNAYGFNIPPEEATKLVPGVAYKIVPINNDATYKWVIPSTITFTYSK